MDTKFETINDNLGDIESYSVDASTDSGGELSGDSGEDLNAVSDLPANRGAVPGTEYETTLPRGTIGVRYGNPETGVFAAPYDTPPEQLNIPSSNSGEPNYFVVTDHDGVPVTESIAADGGGTQWDFGEGNPISGYDNRHYPDNKPIQPESTNYGEDLNVIEPSDSFDSVTGNNTILGNTPDFSEAPDLGDVPDFDNVPDMDFSPDIDF